MVLDGNSTLGHEGEDDRRPNQVIFIYPRGRVSLDGVTITQGHSHVFGGGAILNLGDLAIYNSILTKNSTHGKGGAIYNKGNLWILESTLSYNWSKPNILQDFDGDGKQDPVSGGAIANIGGRVLMYNVTISGNLGGQNAKGDTSRNGDAGGGILNVGGGIFQMNNSTIAYNQTNRGNGAGIYNDPISYVNIWNTIIANNYYNKDPKNRDDCRGEFGSFGYNLVGSRSSSSKLFGCLINSGPGDMVGGHSDFIYPLLGSLSQNGGPTPTHALLDESPAIDAGNPDPAGFAACAEIDQRSVPRPKDGPVQGVFDGLRVCDIGAYEYYAPRFWIDDAAVTEGNSGTTTMSFTVHLSGPSVEPISIHYSTSDGSAKAGSDYRAASGFLLFRPNKVSKSIKVEILGDRTKEPNETFFVNLALSEGIARIEKVEDAQATGTIRNDD